MCRFHEEDNDFKKSILRDLNLTKEHSLEEEMFLQKTN